MIGHLEKSLQFGIMVFLLISFVILGYIGFEYAYPKQITQMNEQIKYVKDVVVVGETQQIIIKECKDKDAFPHITFQLVSTESTYVIPLDDLQLVGLKGCWDLTLDGILIPEFTPPGEYVLYLSVRYGDHPLRKPDIFHTLPFKVVSKK